MAYDSGDFLVRTIMTAASGLPEDRIVNDWAFSNTDGPVTTGRLEDLAGAVGDFFREGATAADRVGSYIGSQVDRGATHEITVTQITVPPLGSPAVEIAWLGPVAPTNNTNLPLEVAGVLSFHGSLTGILEESGATRPRARRRGRVYIGPLTEEAVAGTIPAPTLSAAFTAALRSNAVALFDRTEAIGWEWSVWSRANQQLYPIVAGWTDNAPDTQRRRGQAPSARTVYTTV